MKNIDISDSNPGTPSIDTIDIVNIFIGIKILIDDTITFNPYNKTKENTTFFTTFFSILNI